jgi:hypothetical protein
MMFAGYYLKSGKLSSAPLVTVSADFKSDELTEGR